MNTAALFQTELSRALQKYPPAVWAAMECDEMVDRLILEAEELRRALLMGDLEGNHGILVEAVHAQVVAQRIMDEMRRRAR